jgi:hypothetical protein
MSVVTHILPITLALWHLLAAGKVIRTLAMNCVPRALKAEVREALGLALLRAIFEAILVVGHIAKRPCPLSTPLARHLFGVLIHPASLLVGR